MTENKNWKKIVSGMMALTLVAGTVPANVGGFLTGSTAIVASAEGENIDDNELGEVDIEVPEDEWEYSRCMWYEDEEQEYVALFVFTKGTERENIAGVVTKEVIEPTCEKVGKTVYTAVATFEDKTVTDYKEINIVPATGHKWQTPTYDFTQDDSVCTATCICENGDHPKEEIVNGKFSEVKPATVSAEGVGQYVFEFEDPAFEKQIKEVTIPKLTPVYGEPEYKWSDDYKTATATLPCENGTEADAIVEKVDTTSSVAEGDEATCTKKGKTTYTAVFKDQRFETQTTTVEDIDATGHTYEAPVWKWDDNTKTAVATFYCINDDDQTDTDADDITKKYIVEPTCEEGGSAIYTATVTFDGETYTDSKEYEEEAKGHNWVPTWHWDENNSAVAHFKCSDHEKPIYGAALAEVEEEVHPSSCTEQGYIEYTASVEYDGKLYVCDEEHKVELPLADHEFADPEYVWTETEDGLKCTATRTCKNCDETETEEAVVEYKVEKEATVREEGKGVYTATFENAEFKTQINEVEIAKLEAKYADPVYTWNEDHTECYAVSKCLNGDVDDNIEEYGEISSKVTREATCSKMGETTYYATFENAAFTTVSESIDNIDMIDHEYGVATWSWIPNDDGTYTATMKKTCVKCGDTITYDAEVTSETVGDKIIYTAIAEVDGVKIASTMEKIIDVDKTPDITFEKGDGCVKLTWTAVEGAEKYGIVAYQNGSWTLLNQGYPTSYVLNGLKAGNEYKVAVIAMFDGQWNMDFSNAITVTPNDAAAKYPIVENIEYNEEFHQFRLSWNAVEGAQQYGIAVKLAGKWKVQAYTDKTTFTSPKLRAGSSYEMLVCAKVNGKWDLGAMNSRIFTVTIK